MTLDDYIKDKRSFVFDKSKFNSLMKCIRSVDFQSEYLFYINNNQISVKLNTCWIHNDINFPSNKSNITF